jgi:hypothetical protein
MVNPCNVLDALADFQYDLMRRLNKKFEQLRRLAALLEQLGDLSAWIPDISKLIPIIDINYDLYTQLAASCPFLGLPPVPDEANVNVLRQQVLAAYDNYARQLLNHSFLRMGKLQDELTNFQNKIMGAMGMGSDYIRCLQAICAAGSALGSTVSKLAQTNSAALSKTVSDFKTNFVTNAGQVLTEPMKIKYQQTKDALGVMQGLGADVGKDYSQLKTTRASTFTSRPTADTAGTTQWKNPPYAPSPS